MSKKIILLLTVFIDVLGMSIIIPVFPFFVKSFGASDFLVTMLISVYALFSFFSAPFLGALSDRIGRRPVLIASILSTAIGWIIFALAGNIFMLFLGRIIDGIAAGNLPTAQNYLIDISKNAKERTSNLGLIGAIFGIGFIIGPMLGGFLASISSTLPFWLVGIMSLVNCILAFLFLPEVKKNDKTKIEKITLNPFKPIIRSMTEKKFLPFFSSWFFFGLAMSAYFSVFSLFIGKVFNLKELAVGMFLTLSGLILVLNQGFLMKNFWLKKFIEPNLLINSFIFLTLGFLLFGFKTIPLLILSLIIIGIGQSLIRPINSSFLAGLSGHRSGEVLGSLASVESLTAIIGPVIAGALFTINPFYPFMLSALFCLIAFFILRFKKEEININHQKMSNLDI